MIDRGLLLSPHFALGELIPADCDFVPADVAANLEALCAALELPRVYMNLPFAIHHNGGYRPPPVNAGAGGVKDSDHLYGRAADFNVSAGHGMTWQANTKAAFLWCARELRGRYGQLILEDQREALADPGKLWVHYALPSTKHPGTGDASALLYSPAPGKYVQWSG